MPDSFRAISSPLALLSQRKWIVFRRQSSTKKGNILCSPKKAPELLRSLNSHWKSSWASQGRTRSPWNIEGLHFDHRLLCSPCHILPHSSHNQLCCVIHEFLWSLQVWLTSCYGRQVRVPKKPNKNKWNCSGTAVILQLGIGNHDFLLVFWFPQHEIYN